MGPVVIASQVVPAQRPVQREFATRTFHLLDQYGVHPARTVCIQQDPYFNATLGRGTQLVGECDGYITFPKHIGQQVHRIGRVADGRQHRRKNLRSIDQKRGVVARQQWCIQVRCQRYRNVG